MATILVSGLINLETTLKIEAFPLNYNPVNYPFFGVRSTVSGVGYNIARALTRLGHRVLFLSIVGNDAPGELVRSQLAADGIDAEGILSTVDQTSQSVIIFESSGRRQIHVDLKNIQEATYPEAIFRKALASCDAAILCNVNFSRPMLAQARAAGKMVITDVHTIGTLDDAYNRDFMANADVLFMSDESLPMRPEAWAQAVQARYRVPVVVIGLGGQGALLYSVREGFMGRIPAVKTRPIVNTIGAGDSLLSAFVHSYVQTRDAYRALQKATLFASWKIGTSGAADGFLDADELDMLERQVQNAAQ